MRVTVVMAVYNGEKYLNKALSSILRQTYQDIEIIIVNDGSTDNTKAILEDITDPRVRVINLPMNLGGANALNTGIKEAQGTWIAIQDADDLSYPTRIAEQINFLTNNPRLVGVGTMVEYFSEDPNISNDFLVRLAKRKNSLISSKQLSKKRFYICDLTHSSMMFSKDIFNRVGGYNPELKILYDYDLWLKIMEKGPIAKVPQVLLRYNFNPNSLSHLNKLNTANEIQLVSSWGIARLLNQQKINQPQLIVVGNQRACENYQQMIAPQSGLTIKGFIYQDLLKQLPVAGKAVKKEKIQGIIALGGSQRYIEALKKKGLELNRNLFHIYSILK